ncbi:hypothetical protein [Kingella sp. (in: b-proteobacteria)]|nr:hypothetical protein [Kingella sp. (in: b-proteobacteria)]MDO4657208.1 hypothetical protein [Kingella sp. (in: b-proteobacteria)]
MMGSLKTLFQAALDNALFHSFSGCPTLLRRDAQGSLKRANQKKRILT